MGAAFALKKEKDYNVITVDGEFRKELIPEIRQSVEDSTANKECKALVVDLSASQIMDDSTMAELVIGAKKLKENGAKLYIVKANQAIQSKIVSNGVNQTLIIRKDQDEALTDAGLKSTPKNKMDVTIVNPFIEGAIKTFKIQANIESTAGTPFVKGTAPAVPADIVAILGITSLRFNGAIALCFSKQLFLHIVNTMFGETYTDINDDNADAAGELLNIIFGCAKESLNKLGCGIQPAIPTVIRGDSIQTKNIMSEPTIVLPMTTPFGNYEIHIGIIKTK